VGTTGLGVYLDFADAIGRLGEPAVRERYGNLFDIYHEITAENAYKAPMRIYPAVHYTMGGLWVDYNLMSNIPGLFVLGEANFSDHGANRLGASALMQGLADGYFVIPYTVGDYLAGQKPGSRPSTDGAEFKQAEDNVRGLSNRLLATKGKQPVSYFHKKLGKIIWDHCGMSRTKAGLESALQKIPALREEFNATVNVPGSAETLNQSLEKAGRVADLTRSRARRAAAGTSAKNTRRPTASANATTKISPTSPLGSIRATARPRCATPSRSTTSSRR